MLEDSLDYMRVVVDTTLVRHVQKQRIGFGNSLVPSVPQ